jgi:hypothetical protein
MKQAMPSRFEARIGGVMGFSFSASLTDKGVEYTEFAEGYTPMVTKVICPTPDQWQALHRVMGKVEFWQWNPEYFNPDVLDGTSWELECHWGDHTIQTAGSNAFPSDPDARRPTYSENESKRFDSLLRAISQLLGGEPFE